MEGIIYVLSNPAMPGMLKIGMTTRDEIEIRMNELYTTGVPLPFECCFAGKTNDIQKVERVLHTTFGPYRINPKREFFEIEEIQIVDLLKLLCTEDMTPEVNVELDKVDEASKDAVKRYKSKRPKLNFLEMNIPIGSTLLSMSNDDTCIVESENKVIYKGESMSLTRATKISLNNSYNVSPCPQWTYNGINLSDIYDETYEHTE